MYRARPGVDRTSSILALRTLLLWGLGSCRLGVQAATRAVPDATALAVDADGQVRQVLAAASVEAAAISERLERQQLMRRKGHQAAAFFEVQAAQPQPSADLDPAPPAAPLGVEALLRGERWELWKERSAALWLLGSSLAFLWPAWRAHRERWYWPAGLFALQALICFSYHFCDTASPQLHFGTENKCSEPLTRGLTHLDHGLAYYIFLQMALAVLGPEDPVLQSEEMTTVAHLSADKAAWRARCLEDTGMSPVQRLMQRRAEILGVPVDVILLSRVATPITLLMLLRFYSSWDNFHKECCLWGVLAMFVNMGLFWQARHKRGAAVLLRRCFWQRVLQWLVAPLLLSGAVFVVMENHAGRAWEEIHGLWHVILSSLAATAMVRIQLGESVCCGEEDLQRNPILAQHVLWMTPALVAGAAAVWWNATARHHPLMMPSGFIESKGYLLAFASLCAAMATAAMWGVLDLVSAFHDEEEQRMKRSGAEPPGAASMGRFFPPVGGRSQVVQVHSEKGFQKLFSPLSLRKPAIMAGYGAATTGILLTILAAMKLQDSRAAMCCMIVALALQTMAMGLSTFSVYGYQVTAAVPLRCRLGLVVLAVVTSATLFLPHLFSLATASADWSILFPTSLKFLTLASLLAWPLTWLPEAPEALRFWVQWYRLQPH